MNYIRLINAFWQLRRQRPDFDPYVISLYFALVDKANKEGWRQFQIYREDIINLAGMGPSTYYKARKILKDAGAISFQEGASKLSQCTYSILQLYATRTEGDTVRDTEGDTEDGTEGDTILNKHINLKTYKPSSSIPTATVFLNDDPESKLGMQWAAGGAAQYAKYKPPTLEEVVKYFIETGSDEPVAKVFYTEYENANWFNKAGHKMSNWQKTALNWIKNEKEGQRRRELQTESAMQNPQRIAPQLPKSQFDKRNQQYQSLTADSDYDEQGRRISA